jgi:hypothetical protein
MVIRRVGTDFVRQANGFYYRSGTSFARAVGERYYRRQGTDFVSIGVPNSTFSPLSVEGLDTYFNFLDQSLLTEVDGGIDSVVGVNGLGSASAPVSTRRPVFVEGQGAVFDRGSDDELRGEFSSLTNAATLFVVANVPTFNNDETLLHTYNGSGFGFRLFRADGTNSLGALYRNGSNVSTFTSPLISFPDESGTAHIFSARIDVGSTLLELSVDGTVGFSNASLSLNASTSSMLQYILNNDSSGGDNMDMTVSDMLLYSRALSDEEYEMVQGYLAHVRGIESLLPVDHPYKVSPP